MANLKSITELPVATSADGVNLIVNDNGYAKQIAAGAVGAQADWNVEDEANPAFVKNKPFYDTREYGTKTFSFDGDITGKEVIEVTSGMYYVKLYDIPLSMEEIVGCSAIIVQNGTRMTAEITEDIIMIDENGNLGISNKFVMVIYNELTSDQFTLTPGVWGVCIIQDGVPVTYMAEFSWYGVTSGELKQIDEKYIHKEEYDLDIEIYASFDATTQEHSMDLVVNSANFKSAYEKFKANIMPKAKVMVLSVFTDENGIEDTVKAIYISTDVDVLWDSATNSIPESEPIIFKFHHDGSTEYIGLNPDNSVIID